MQKTKTNLQLIAFALMSLFLFSCNQNKEPKSTADENGVREIKVDLKKSKEIDLADFADEVKYVKLETNEESVFSSFYSLKINSEGIFILDNYSTGIIYHFTLDGKFLNTIGVVGRGPNEYTQARDFLVDTVTKTIEIIDCFVTSSLFRYNYNGDFLQRIEYGNKELSRFRKLQDGKYLVKYSDGPNLGETQFAILTPDFKIVNEFVPLDYPVVHSTASYFSNNIESSILFTYGYGDTIYQYKNESVQAKYHVNFDNARIPDEKRKPNAEEAFSLIRKTELNYAAYSSGLCWNHENVFFYVTSKGEKHLVCYDIESQQTTIYSEIVGSKDKNFSIINRGIYNSSLIYTIEAMNISEKMKSEDTTEKQSFGLFSSFEEVQKNTYADDNPILVFMKPKSDL